MKVMSHKSNKWNIRFHDLLAQSSFESQTSLCFLILFFKALLLWKKFQKVHLRIFPLLQTAQSHVFHTDPAGLSMFLHVLGGDTSYDGQWSIVFMPGSRVFEEKMQVLKKVVHVKGTCYVLLARKYILECTLEKLLDTLWKWTVNRMQWPCTNH